MNRKWIAAAAGVCLSVCMMTGCGSKKEEAAISREIRVETQTAQAGTLELTSDYIGTVSPHDRVNVTPMVSGLIKSVHVKEGDKVKAGDVLCRFDDTAADLSVESAENAVDSAKAGKKAAKGQQKAASAQSNASIESMEQSIKTLKSQLKEAEKQKKKLAEAKKKSADGLSAAQKAYNSTKKMYKSAEALYIQYQAFLKANPDCQTTAGLIAAANMPDASTAVPVLPDPSSGTSATEGSTDVLPAADEADAEKKETASRLLEALTEEGLTVEYLTDAGLNSLKENMTEAETANKAAQSAGSEIDTGIATLDSTIKQLKAQIETTESSLKAAKKAAGAAGGGDDVYNAQIKSAETGVDAAEYQKSLYTVTAPIDGVVTSVNVKKDEMASQAMPAFVISGQNSILVTFYVTEEVKNRLQIGQQVTFKDDDPDNKTIGQISSIGTAVDDMKGLFKVEAECVVYSDRFSSGTSVPLQIVSDRVEGKILIPYDSVYYEDNQAYVFVVEDGTAVRKDITTGLFNDDTIAVESGLNAGDEVITTWASGLKEGAKIAK
ncbi:MAG: efflux RND transporter periplasmic adaptor subunit [Eubacterium sp.]|nr:efflux RND transporter periplasmic adaptor subunit [Eubacterium sp.]